MKTHRVLFLALVVSAALAVSVEAGDRRGNNDGSRVAPSRGRSSGSSFSSGSGFRYGSGRMMGPTQRFSSMGVRSTPTPPRLRGQRSTFNSGGNVGSIGQRQFTAATLSRDNGVARFENSRARNLGTIQQNHGNRVGSIGNGNRSLAGGSNHVFARRSADWHRDWDRNRDHSWHGHRCRFVNGSWFVFDLGFFPGFGWPYYAYDYPYYPYGYGGYGYGAYGYDPGVYDQSNYYDQGGYNYNEQSDYYDQGGNGSASYDQSTAATVADLQDKLARAGYYHGQIDGVLGPETRHALLRYQSDKGLGVTGSLTMETRQSLGLGQGARY